MSRNAVRSSTLWEQAGTVRSRLAGTPWHQSFTGPVPLPSWLVDTVDGHMNAYAGPDPVLFRTAQISVDEWLNQRHDHPEQLEVTCAHNTTSWGMFEDAAAVLIGLADTSDADVYVCGDGNRDGVFWAHIHRVFATLAPEVSVHDAGTHLESISGAFTVTIRQGTVELTPRLSRLRRWRA